MLKAICIILTISFGSFCYADDSVYINQNDKAPFAGYLLPQAKVQEFQNAVIDRDTYKALNDSYQKSLDLEKNNNDLLNKKIGLLMDQNDKLYSNLKSEVGLQTWEKVAYFVGGILVVGLAISGVHDLYR